MKEFSGGQLEVFVVLDFSNNKAVYEGLRSSSAIISFWWLVRRPVFLWVGRPVDRSNCVLHQTPPRIVAVVLQPEHLVHISSGLKKRMFPTCVAAVHLCRAAVFPSSSVRVDSRN